MAQKITDLHASTNRGTTKHEGAAKATDPSRRGVACYALLDRRAKLELGGFPSASVFIEICYPEPRQRRPISKGQKGAICLKLSRN